MLGEVIAVFLLLTLAIYSYRSAYRKPPNFPAGPPSLPVYGAYWIVLALGGVSNLAEAFRRLGEIYKTKIIGLYLGSIPSIVVNDAVLIKQMLYHEAFDGRMDIILGRLRSYWKRLGIFFTDSYFWYIQRRFSLRYLRDFGFGRRSDVLETVVENEIKTMLDMRINGPVYPAEKELVNGDLVYLPHFLAVPFINGLLHVISQTTLHRKNYDVLWELARKSLVFQRASNDLGRALTLTPWLKDIMPNWSGYNDLRRGNECLLDFFTKLITHELETYDESHERHFLDVYFRKMKEEQKSKKKTTFSVDQLVLICTDYMFPTASATESVLTMLLERLLLQPEIQDKIHKEIDRVVGNGRLPNLHDRKNMPYTEACIREAMRVDTLVPLGVPHRAVTTSSFGGYTIPEDSLVCPNYIMLHMDKTIWGDPENFRPERFIKDGQLDVASDKSLPFGAGRRLCAGETFARQTMFQVFAALMQSFRIEPADGRWPSEQAQRIQGIITTIPEFWIKLKLRT